MPASRAHRFSATAFALAAVVLAAVGRLEAQVSDTASSAAVQITFLDVGQGDAVVVRSPEGLTALVDAGRSAPLRFLQQMGVDSLALLVASHPHADHIGGLVDVLTARPVAYYLDSGVPHTTATYARLMETLELLDGVTYLEAVPRTLELGSVEIEVLPLPSSGHEINDRSVGLILRFGEFSAFLSGDSERRELDFWVRDGVVPDVTLLKAPHHGSVAGFTRDFLGVARPEVVVVSVGGSNGYGHPRPEAMTAFGAVADTVLRTDRDGHVTVLGRRDGSWEIVLGSEAAGGEAGATADPGAGDASVPGRPTPRGLSIEIVPGRGRGGHPDLNAEYAVLTNHGPLDVGLGGMRLCDLTTRCFRFPPGVRVSAGEQVRVYTGYGMTDGRAFFMNNDRPVWNEDGDEARLLDPLGRVVLRTVY